MDKALKSKDFLFLHVLFALYSCSGILAKLANRFDFLSLNFLLLFAFSVSLLGVYAVLWQFVLRKFPLTIAFSNKGVVVIWGMIWGSCIFKESITFGKVIGAALIAVGVVIMGKSNE
jgi:multidrug transporter EmrE-like cation transporter